MTDILGRWNKLTIGEAVTEVLPCNGSQAWAAGVVERRPYTKSEELYAASDEVWRDLAEAEWREAFATHPPIGESHATASVASLSWSAQEQGAAKGGSQHEAFRLDAGNRAYEAKFGRTFLVCATGRTKAQILAALEARMQRTDAEELHEAVEQQRQITQLRLRRWLEGE